MLNSHRPAVVVVTTSRQTPEPDLLVSDSIALRV
jgi:hypothetical protein